MSFADALSDLKVDVLNGKSVDEVIGEIAEIYKINPVLLRRKFAESYRSEEALRATIVATTERNLKDRLAAEIARVCKYYGIRPEECDVVATKQNTYTVLGRKTARSNRVVAVRHSDAKTYLVPIRAFVR